MMATAVEFVTTAFVFDEPASMLGVGAKRGCQQANLGVDSCGISIMFTWDNRKHVVEKISRIDEYRVENRLRAANSGGHSTGDAVAYLTDAGDPPVGRSAV